MKPTVILCPITIDPQKEPGHKLYGSNYFEEVGRTEFGKEVRVRYVRYLQTSHSVWRNITVTIELAYKVLRVRHDVLYFRHDPAPLYLLAILHTLGLYRKPMFAWMYIPIVRSGSRLKDLAKKLVYRGFEKIFMMTGKHVHDSVAHGLVSPERVVHMPWGEDLKYVDRFKGERSKTFTFITTGKAYRDVETLCEAFGKVKGDARLKIFIARESTGIDYAAYLDKVRNPHIEVVYSQDIDPKKLGYEALLDYLFSELHKAHCAVCICQPINFGVGYTQVLDSLACSLPMIATYNVDNPIDIDGLRVGVTVQAGDVDGLAHVMNRMVGHPDLCKEMGERGRLLIEQEYNIRKTAIRVLEYCL